MFKQDWLVTNDIPFLGDIYNFLKKFQLHNIITLQLSLAHNQIYSV